MVTAATDTEELVALNVRCIPRELRSRFKEYCVRQERDMQDVVVELIEDLLVRERARKN